ncbi:MAG: DNA-binding protein [Kangiella sp.]|nr:MAG: DNA-binding protein [Kangiella sp.]
MNIHLITFYYLALISLLTFCVYAYDKSAAKKGKSRISERTLHLLSFFGGWSGALLAQKLLRHKTIKQPFRTIFWLSLFANLGIVGWLLFAENSQFLHEMIKS